MASLKSLDAEPSQNVSRPYNWRIGVKMCMCRGFVQVLLDFQENLNTLTHTHTHTRTFAVLTQFLVVLFLCASSSSRCYRALLRCRCSSRHTHGLWFTTVAGSRVFLRIFHRQCEHETTHYASDSTQFGKDSFVRVKMIFLQYRQRDNTHTRTQPARRTIETFVTSREERCES